MKVLRQCLIYALCGVIGWFVLLSIGHYILVLNHDASVPEGLYLRTWTIAAPYAWFCLEGESEQEAILHGLPAIKGSCPDHVWSLLKSVYRGKLLQYTPDGFYRDAIVDEAHLMINTAPLLVDSQGRPLHHYPYGLYRVDDQHVWMISTFNYRSYDSRYFGPIAKEQIISYAIPLLVSDRH